MGAPFAVTTVNNYNTNPPPDDASQVPANLITWANEKSKLTDPLKTAFEASETATLAAFGKVWGGGGITSTAISYQVLAADQGKLVKGTAAGITITTPDATSVGSPFVFAFLNSSSGSWTLDGSGSQTIDGQASITVAAGQGGFLVTDGTNWNTCGLGGILAGNQLAAGVIINGTIAESNGSNAVTFAVKNLAGNDPTATDPVIVAFRNVTAGTGNYVYRSITAACSITLPSTATAGFANGTAARLWLGLLDNAGTVELFAINCLSGTSIYPLGQFPLITTTTISTGSDNAHVAYSTTGRTSKPYVVLGYASYESGLSTAGSWNASPTRLHLQGPNDPLPGARIQVQRNFSGAVATGSTAIPYDDTVPQITEGDQYFTQAITPTSTANVLEIEAQIQITQASTGDRLVAALFQDANASALAIAQLVHPGSGLQSIIRLFSAMLAGTTSSTTMRIRAGGTGTGTTTVNGDGGARKYGGAYTSYLQVAEFMA